MYIIAFKLELPPSIFPRGTNSLRPPCPGWPRFVAPIAIRLEELRPSRRNRDLLTSVIPAGFEQQYAVVKI